MKMNFKDLRDRSSTSLKSSFNPKREILHSKEKRERSVRDLLDWSPLPIIPTGPPLNDSQFVPHKIRSPLIDSQFVPHKIRSPLIDSQFVPSISPLVFRMIVIKQKIDCCCAGHSIYKGCDSGVVYYVHD
jgi:hypothetical protein